MDSIAKKKRMWARGATLVEMAVVFPLLLMVTLGAIKYGWLFLKAQQMTNAARQAARMAILPDADATEVTAAITNLLAAAGIGSIDEPAYTLDPPLSVTGPIVTVGIKVDPNTVDLIPGYLPNPENLYVRITMAKEGMITGPFTP